MTPAAARTSDGPTVYPIHFETPYRHARHYTGWTAGDLDERLAEDAAGRGGARLMAVIAQAGIG